MSRFVSVEEAQKLSALFNSVRLQWSSSHEFSASEIQDILKNAQFPSNRLYMLEYPKFGIIIRKSRGVYCFPKDPVHFTVFQKCFSMIRKEASVKYSENKSKEIPQVTQPTETLNVEDCIAFLKEKGYLILKIC